MPLSHAEMPVTPMPVLPRKPRRLTITVSAHVYQRLIEASDQQGRSLSNYAAYMLETSLERLQPAGRWLDAVDSARSLQPLPVFRHQFERCRDTDSPSKTKQPVA